MSWTDQETATAQKLWAEGRSAAEIGKLIRKSRNAVIGKVYRTGWTSKGRAPAAAPARGGASGPRPRKPAASSLARHLAELCSPREALPAPAITSAVAMTPIAAPAVAAPPPPALLDVRRELIRAALARRSVKAASAPAVEPTAPAQRTCAWLSDTAEATCSAAAREGSRYCEHHHGRVYQAGSTLSPAGLRNMVRGSERRRAAPDDDDGLIPLDEEVA